MNGYEIVKVLSRWLRFEDATSHSKDLGVFCPFHGGGKEASPSMYVYVGPPDINKAPGAAFCHACHKGWSLTRLLQDLGADRAVVDMVRSIISAETRKYKADLIHSINFDLPELPERVLSVFDYCPTDMTAKGFTQAILQENDVGYDRDLQRITYGLRDHHGTLVGVSGREMEGVDGGRYKIYKSEFQSIYPGYDIDKSKLLWGLDKFYHTRISSASEEPVIVVEGFKAALWVKQAGFDHVVALIGSSLSKPQEVLLGRIANEIVLFLDHDPAGRKATWTIPRQLKGMEVRIVDYGCPHDAQPDDLKVETIREMIDAAPSARIWRKRNG